MRRVKLIFLLFFSMFCVGLFAQGIDLRLRPAGQIVTGAQQIEEYLPKIAGRTVGLVANQASLVGKRHLVDTLLRHKVNVKAIFTPEHGFRGDQDAGATISDAIDGQTGLPIISLYGNHKKPTPDDLVNIDVMLFDLQDVGVRFYTYISTLALVMEACAENNIPLIVLDRPNPNGFYVDGPVLEDNFQSFVGMHPVPVVYGLTIGEYAMMVNGEDWLNAGIKCDLTVVKMVDYDRMTINELPIKPSPNLPNFEAVYLYPSLCFFEGTEMSVGRGTEWPFQVFGHPKYLTGSFVFTPRSMHGAAYPKLENQQCFGMNLTGYAKNFAKNKPYQLNLDWLINAYKELPDKTHFFNNYFNKLAGNATLQQQIIDGMSAEEIRVSWKEGLDRYKKIRIKYLLYPDFQ
jgi:uncharacterized protein YbbC (DUF1343 family)